MTYCAAPPDFNIIGYCADTELHCTNTHKLQKKIVECKRDEKFAVDNGASGMQPKVLTISSQMITEKKADSFTFMMKNDTWELLKVNIEDASLDGEKVGVIFVRKQSEIENNDEALAQAK